MSLYCDLQPYLDEDGLVNPGRGIGSNNGVLYTAQAYMFEPCPNLLKPIKNCFILKGLLSRHPAGHGGQEGPDDYVGLGVAAYFAKDKQMAQDVIDYGWNNKGFFNNVTPDDHNAKAFLVRQPQLIALFYWAAGRKPLFPLVLWTAIVIATSGRDKDQDSCILAWMLSQVAIKESWLCRQAYKLFVKRLLKLYPGGMPEVTSTYFEAGHPLVSVWPKY